MTAYRANPGEGFIRALVKDSWLKEEESALEQAFDILKRLNLDHLWNEESQKLRGGQTKLLEVGRALMSGAKLLLMDEPAAGINPVLAHEVLTHLKEIGQRLGITFLVVEHRLDVALQYVDYVYAMARGKIISEGKGEKVLSDPAVIESYLGR
jgi:branched-chain amino acid transport system ATP-binding protein